MALKDYFVRSEKVTFHGGEFEVFPLTLVSVIVVLGTEQRRKELKNIFDQAEAQGVTKDPNMAQIVQFLIKHAPGVLGDLIAAAAQEPDQAEAAAKLPISVQIDALNKIVSLTFEAEGGIKKFGESVVALMAQFNGVMQEINNTQSTDSSKDFIGSAQS